MRLGVGARRSYWRCDMYRPSATVSRRDASRGASATGPSSACSRFRNQ